MADQQLSNVPFDLEKEQPTDYTSVASHSPGTPAPEPVVSSEVPVQPVAEPPTPDQFIQAAKQSAQTAELAKQYANQANAVSSAYDAVARAKRAEAAAQAEQAKAEAAYLDAFNKEAQQRLVRDERAKDEAVQRLKQEEEKLAVLNQELQKMGEIDPNRFWSSKDTAGKIRVGLAVILGAMGSAAKREQGNFGIELLEKAIERDMAAQKSGRDAKQLGITNQQNLLDILRSRFTTEEDAKNAYRAAAYDQAKNMLEQYAAQFKQPQIKAQADMAAQEIELKKQEALQRLQESAKRSAFTEYGSEVFRLDPSQVDPARLSKEQRDLFVPGYGFASSPKNAENFQKYRAEVEPAITGIERIFSTINDPNFSRLSPDERAKVSVEIQALVGQLRLPFVGPGALTDKEYERIKDTLGNPNKLFTLPSWERTKLATVYNKLKQDMLVNAKNAGIPGFQPVRTFREE